MTPYEIMKYLLLYCSAGGETLKNIILHSQIFIDYAMCEYATMKYSPLAVALSGILQGHKAAKHEPKQWLEAIKEIDMHPTEDKDVRACCITMQNQFDFAGIDLPPMPAKSDIKATTPRQQVTPPVPENRSRSVSPQNKKIAKNILPSKHARSRNGAQNPVGSKRQPIKFHSTPKESGPPLKRPRAVSVAESPAAAN